MLRSSSITQQVQCSRRVFGREAREYSYKIGDRCTILEPSGKVGAYDIGALTTFDEVTKADCFARLSKVQTSMPIAA